MSPTTNAPAVTFSHHCAVCGAHVGDACPDHPDATVQTIRVGPRAAFPIMSTHAEDDPGTGTWTVSVGLAPGNYRAARRGTLVLWQDGREVEHMEVAEGATFDVPRTVNGYRYTLTAEVSAPPLSVPLAYGA